MKLLSPEALESYIRHTVDGQAMRELSRQTGREPSTVLRQVRKVEELRDNPEWDMVIEKLSASWDRGQPLDRIAVYKSLGTNAVEVMQELQRCTPHLIQDDALVGITDGCMAGIFVDHEIMRRTDRCIAAAWVAVGWLVLRSGSPRVRRYALTDRALTEVPVDRIVTEAELPEEPPRAKPSTKRRYTGQTWDNEPIDKLRQLARRSGTIKITSAQIDIAQDLRNLMRQAVLDGKGSSTLMLVTELEKRLGPDMFNLIYDFLHVGKGLEQIEKDYGWSARSAKVVLGVTLQQVEHFRLLDAEPEKPAIAAE